MASDRDEARVREALREFGKVAVALSGGLDSSVLLALAVDELGAENCLAVSAVTPYMMAGETGAARKLCRDLGVGRREVQSGIIDEIRFNPEDRCYLCKRFLFTRAVQVARDSGFLVLVDGTNIDDLGDHRPGRRALAELGVRSPWLEAGVGKAGIRGIALRLGMGEWAGKAASACLLTRLRHGERVEEALLARIDAAEETLKALGIRQCRVRVELGGRLARIEAGDNEGVNLVATGGREQVVARFRELGFEWVTLDLGGYRMGSNNA